MARTYSTVRVVSADMPFAVRYWSKVVRRNVPLMRNSKGMGFSDCKRALTRVERAYRRRSDIIVNKCCIRSCYITLLVFTRIGPGFSGNAISG